MLNEIKKEAILNEERGYWAMTISVALLGVLMIGILILKFI